MFKVDNQAGNQCIFMFFVIFNFSLFLASLGILGADVYLFVITREANVFNICFLIIGVVLLVLSLMSFKLRTSIHLLGFYLIMIGLLFVVMFILTVVMIVQKE